MKAFVFSDLHASERQLYNFKKYFEADHDIDLLIFAGDVTNMGEPVGFVNNFIKALDEIRLPFFWVPGNNDFGRAYYKLNAKFPSLEGKVIVIPHLMRDLEKKDPRVKPEGDSLRLTGVGGSPASWAGQYAGEKMIDKKSIADSIFVSHVPPPGILTMVRHDIELERYSNGTMKQLSDVPVLHICGHLHSRWGCGYLGTTKVINPGALVDGRYGIIDL